MTRTYIADAKADERSALRLVLLDLKMNVVGEASDWLTTLAEVPLHHVEVLLIDWDLLPESPGKVLSELRKVCLSSLVIIIISYLDARHQAAFSVGADAFISKGETSDRVTEYLRSLVSNSRFSNVE
jgi:DNA-binding NarL/FixJ family response regulator